MSSLPPSRPFPSTNPFQKQGQRTQAEWEELIGYFVNYDAEYSKERSSRGEFPPFPKDEEIEMQGTIDHTLLKVDADRVQIDHLCEEARTHGFKSVCVRLPWVRRCEENLRGSSVIIACVVGFHEGTYATAEKVKEATEAVAAGAKELDMVMNYVELKKQNFVAVFEDIAEVCKAVHPNANLKVILETSQLSRQELINGCLVAHQAGADFVKTSTGFNGEGATVENVALMWATVNEAEICKASAPFKPGRGFIGEKPGLRVKASGGIRDVDTALKMLAAGASRLGTSSGVKIMDEWTEHVKKEGTETNCSNADSGNQGGPQSRQPRATTVSGKIMHEWRERVRKEYSGTEGGYTINDRLDMNWVARGLSVGTKSIDEQTEHMETVPVRTYRGDDDGNDRDGSRSMEPRYADSVDAKSFEY